MPASFHIILDNNEDTNMNTENSSNTYRGIPEHSYYTYAEFWHDDYMKRFAAVKRMSQSKHHQNRLLVIIGTFGWMTWRAECFDTLPEAQAAFRSNPHAYHIVRNGVVLVTKRHEDDNMHEDTPLLPGGDAGMYPAAHPRPSVPAAKAIKIEVGDYVQITRLEDDVHEVTRRVLEDYQKAGAVGVVVSIGKYAGKDPVEVEWLDCIGDGWLMKRSEIAIVDTDALAAPAESVPAALADSYDSFAEFQAEVEKWWNLDECLAYPCAMTLNHALELLRGMARTMDYADFTVEYRKFVALCDDEKMKEHADKLAQDCAPKRNDSDRLYYGLVRK